jgi:hypothetical protein
VTQDATGPPEDYDSPWKEALERYFEPFLLLFFPPAHAGIDWTRGYEFLDKELQQVVRDASLGRRLVDKLARVWRRDGREAWVLIHIEVQGQVEPEFARRMYVYNYRLFDRYDREVASLAVLGDDRADWRPHSFGYDLWGCQPGIRFPVVKLLDYEADWESLESNPNPFAVVVMAHLRAQATHGEPQSRLRWKLRLVKGLYERGFNREDVLELFRVIDWMMALPQELERRFDQEFEKFEEERAMPYVTSIERRAIERGRAEGLQQGRLEDAREAVIDNLEARFKHVPEAFHAAIQGVQDVDRLRELRKHAAVTPSLEAFQQSL